MPYSDAVNISKEDLQTAIIKELQNHGLRPGLVPKKLLKPSQGNKAPGRTGHVFRKPLRCLSSKLVPLRSGVEAEVPNFVLESCLYVLKHGDVEGLFRKAGSNARQRELRAWMDEGRQLDLSDHHVIDIANTLKFFLRELPEPVLPFAFHDVFLHCLLLDDILSSVLLVCLLLPRAHLHTLGFIMEFFQQIAQLSASNKMDSNNLAIVVTPTIMPVTDKVSVMHNSQRLNGHVRIVELLIRNADKIGVIPDGVTDRLSLTSAVSNASMSSDDLSSGRTDLTFSAKKKKRRSGSLTRMFNGLKKIVGGKGSPDAESDLIGTEEEAGLISSTPDFSTPCVKSAKKRKASDTENAFSSKKKRNVLQSLPQSTTLADPPFTPCSVTAGNYNTPRVCPHPNPTTAKKSKSKSPQKHKHRRFFQTRTCSESEKTSAGNHPRKGILGVSDRLSKKQKHSGERHSTGGSFLERSWSAVSSSSWGRKKNLQSERTRLSLLSTSTSFAPLESDSSHDADVGIDLSHEDPSTSSDDVFVQIPKCEYESLKNRMSAIESRISQEFGQVTSTDSTESPEVLNAASTALAVQTAYEKTLEGADVTKDTTTDQLAKRLSRELKIRRSVENKVIRSPSARKIGSLRRRSRERQSPSVSRELRRNKSWHMLQRPAGLSSSAASNMQESAIVHSSNLRRGRPNTIFSGLPHPTPCRSLKSELDLTVDSDCQFGSEQSPRTGGSVTRSQARRASSFHGDEKSSPQISSSKKFSSHVNITKAALLAQAQQKTKCNNPCDEVWHDAVEILNKSKDALQCPTVTGRESIAKLRSENAGKVLATAKLFSANMELTKPVECTKNKMQVDKSDSGKTSDVKGPIRFARNCEATRSLRLAYGTSQVTGGKPIGRATRFPTHLQESSAVSSPRKTGTPRRRNNGQKSPNMSMRRQRLRIKTSPTQNDTPPVNQKVKKHNSLKSERVSHTLPVKRNLSVPVHWVDSGKENQVEKPSPHAKLSKGMSPQPVKEAAPRVDRVSVSPLKDCNRIGMQLPSMAAPKFTLPPACLTPSIKQPLTTRSPRRVGLTPQNLRMRQVQTPLKALVASAATPIRSPRRQSPRLQQHNGKGSHHLIRPCN